MISELREFPHSHPLEPAGNHAFDHSRNPSLAAPVGSDAHRHVAGRPLPLVCPECREPIPLVGRLCGNRLIDAILLQAERIGAELDCRKCGLRFIFHRSPSTSLERHAPHQRTTFPHLIKKSKLSLRASARNEATTGVESGEESDY